MNTTIYITLAIILLTAIWNGLVIKWGLEKDKSKVIKISKYWHGIGFVIRALLVTIVFLTSGNWWWSGGAAFLCWLPYNMIINIYMKQPLFYIGRTSSIDKLIRKILHLK